MFHRIVSSLDGCRELMARVPLQCPTQQQLRYHRQFSYQGESMEYPLGEAFPRKTSAFD